MTTYYPTQGSAYAGHAQPVVYAASNGYHPGYAPAAGAYLGQPEVIGVPYQGSHHSHRSRHSHRSHHHSHAQTVIVPAAAPVVMQQPVYGVYTPAYPRLSFGERLRRFFGLAPRGPFKYRNNKGTWGFMGYSRRQRYSDARTGAEVDRKGRPIYRV